LAATKKQEKESTASICDPLAHPMRVRILEVVNEHPMSPVQFINAGYAPGFETKQKALSFVSYHFRALEKAGCLEVAETVPRRGATEHIYRGRTRVFFTDEEFERMPLGERSQLSRTSFQGLVARTDGAMAAGTFDARTDRHLTWRAMELDPRGWSEMTAAMAACFYELERIRQDAAERLAGSGESAIPTTFAMLAYESPSRPSLH
jgi:hypothetical protein